MGFVGQQYARSLELISRVVTYDISDDRYPYDELSACDLAIVCVDTPGREDGSADTRHVFEAVMALPCNNVIIKSTVPPGTTNELRRVTGKRVTFSPEFMGEGPSHPRSKSPFDVTFVVLGGDDADLEQILPSLAVFYPVEATFFLCTSVEAELIKYMENAFLAMKVAFVNEFFDIARAVGGNWYRVREGWLLDPRVGSSHSVVYEHDRGFSGKCLPKDLTAIIESATRAGVEPLLLRAIVEGNAHVKQRDYEANRAKR